MSGVHEPSVDLLAWVEHALGGHARVVGSRRLTGGLTSNVHLLTVGRNGGRDECVLRWWAPTGEAQEWNARAVTQETAVLAKLEGSGIPAPRVIASTTAAALGGPALLMTRLPGTLQLMPHDREQWLQEMARMLARIHALAIEGRPFTSWLDPGQLSPPPDASRVDVWNDAIALAAAKPAPPRSCFLHRDYQHFNMLWSGERLTGVVDWIEACVGPPGIDVGHCRLNLALLCSADVADRFLAIYEAETGQRVDARWDVHALLSYGLAWKEFLPIQIDGRAPLDIDGMTGRVEDLLARALRRL